MSDEQLANTNNVVGTQNNVTGNQYIAGGNIIIHNADGSARSQTIAGVWQWYNSEGGAFDPQLRLRDDAEYLAIVVSVTGKIVGDVYQFLKDQHMSAAADIVVLTNLDDPRGKPEPLRTTKQWLDLADNYRDLLIHSTNPQSRKLLVFISAPVAIGYMLGTRAGYNSYMQYVYHVSTSQDGNKHYELVAQFRPTIR